MSELPKGWAYTSVFDIATPKQWKTIPKKQLLDEGYDVYGANGIIGKYSDYTHEKPTLMITCRGASCGNVHISKPKSYINGNAMTLDSLTNMVDINYLYFYLKSSDFKNVISGSAQPQITQEGLTKLELKIAPLNEQKRIADKLDSLLAKVDKAQARLEKIPTILKRFRQSVLAAATSGELTKQWRDKRDLSENSWSLIKIDDLAKRAFDGPFGSKLKTADYTSHGVKVARLENIGHLEFKAEKETFISELKYQELAKQTLAQNDVLFSSFVDEEIRVCLFEEKFGTYINKADCFCIRSDEEKILAKYLMYSLACKHTYEKIKKQVHGATRPRVNLRFLKSFELTVPSKEEQVAVIERVDILFAKADKVERQYIEAKARIDRLTQSILAKAFRGELVAQDENDEPAEQLLARIQESMPKPKAKKKTKK
ncbi:restriction endonuclease subunit S [Vibrio aestuarianus]|uniref:restriction endonuclease subunit S n=1 Tax=Vibrio aestuarianus TaxID=28171 RepID=UPI00237D2D26|nr:restriction endonuclease subunit S [Vibrio aestuarianus]MDE1348534.1 restriction endonuclease subunit S [Vibrio aestuarianus]